MPATAQSQLDRFEVRHRIGSGGAGEVYMAFDKLLLREVALKRLRPDKNIKQERSRLLSEAQRASRLSHPNVTAVHDVIEDGEDLVIVMEYVPGGTLRKRLQGPLPLSEFSLIAFQCLEGVQAAHEIGIIHADLKPENILMSGDRVKVCDFGLARTLPDSETTTLGSTETAVVAGTPPYIAPEVLLSGGCAPQSDIFALGVMFYEMLAGQRPFQGSTAAEIFANVLHTEPVPLRDRASSVPPSVARTIHRMLAKSPGDRFVRVADVLQELRTASIKSIAGPTSRVFAAVTGVLAFSLLLLAALFFGFEGRILQAFTLKAIPPKVSLVVMPFQSRGGTAEQRLVGEGLIDTMTAQLTGLTLRRTLQVWPAAEVRNRKVSNADDARKEFGANLILTGDIQWAGDVARINYALVNTSTYEQIRAGTITEMTTNPFALQDRVVQAVLDTLQIELLPNEASKVSSGRTPHVGAQELYLQGRGYLQNYDRIENIDNAITVFERSLREDPNYARAYAGLGDAYWRKFDVSKSSEWASLSRSACERAAGLSPQLPEAQGCLGTVAVNTGRYEEAIEYFRKALDGAPTEDGYYTGLARAYERMGRRDEAEEVFRRAIQLRPHYWAGYNSLGAFYARNGRYRDALEMFNQVVSVAPDSARGHSNAGAMYYQLGRYNDARIALEQSMSIRTTPLAASNLGTVSFFLGDYAGAAAAFRKAVEFSPKDYRLWGNLASALKWSKQDGAAGQSFMKTAELAEEIRRINPKDAQAVISLGDAYANLGNPQKATALINEALSLAPDDPDILFKAAVAYEYHFSDRTRALALLGKAVARNYPWNEIDQAPPLENLRSDPRFAQLRQSSQR